MKTIFKAKGFLLFACFCFSFSYGNSALGQNSAASIDNQAQIGDSHYYEEITMDKLSKLYWKLQKFNLSDTEAIDNYLLINECEIFKEYHFNELEWKGIRENAKTTIMQNVESFPDRFKFTQPLLLDEYDVDTQRFNINPSYQINGIRKFEVWNKEGGSSICTAEKGDKIPGYPAVLLVELTQPINLSYLEMTKDQAEEYIDDKLRYVENLPPEKRVANVARRYRDAYIVFKVKMMSFKGTDYIENVVLRSIVYAMLEGYEVYADKEHTKLLHFKNFLRDENATPVDIQLKDQYQALRSKRGLPVEDIKEDSSSAQEVKPTPQTVPAASGPSGEEKAPSIPQQTGSSTGSIYDELNNLQ